MCSDRVDRRLRYFVTAAAGYGDAVDGRPAD
ncbi:hypothetical protein ABH926_010086 [Catenulispora sp. GP43]